MALILLYACAPLRNPTAAPSVDTAAPETVATWPAHDTLDCPEAGTGDDFGGFLAVAGNIDGTGDTTLLVSAAQADGATINEGFVAVFDSAGRQWDTWTATTPIERMRFGSAVVGVGDHDGDGLDDVVVGGSYDETGVGESTAFVLFGGSGGPDRDRDVQLLPPDHEPSGLYGSSLGAPGDLDGDGLAELAVGYPGAGGDMRGAVDLYRYPSAEAERLVPDGLVEQERFATLVDHPADVDGDGYGDLLVGSNRNYRGAIYLYAGSVTGPSGSAYVRLDADDALGEGSYLGVLDVGDRDGDGRDEVLVGDLWANHAAVLGASAEGFATDSTRILDLPEPEVLVGTLRTGRFVPDLDGDTLPEIALGADSLWTDALDHRGGVWIYDASGDPVRLLETPAATACLGASMVVTPDGLVVGDRCLDSGAGAAWLFVRSEIAP